MRELGYAIHLSGSSGYGGDLMHDGVAVVAGLVAVVSAEGGATYPYINLSIEFAFPREVVPGETERWLAHALPATKATFTPHLGRTVSMSAFLPLANGTTEESLRTSLDGFWADGRAFAAHFGTKFAPVPAFDAKHSRYPDTTVINRVDYISLQRMVQSWGWDSPVSPSILPAGWAFSIRVGDQTLWMHEVREGIVASPSRFSIQRLAPKPTIAAGTSISSIDFAKLPPGTFGGGAFYPVADEITVDLADGVSLGALRRRIEAFAKAR